MKRKPKKHGVVARIFAGLGCIVLFLAGITALFVGLTLEVIVALVLSIAAIGGPATAEVAAEGAAEGFIEMFVEVCTGIIELVGEAFSAIAEAIGSLFSGLG